MPAHRTLVGGSSAISSPDRIRKTVPRCEIRIELVGLGGDRKRRSGPGRAIFLLGQASKKSGHCWHGERFSRPSLSKPTAREGAYSQTSSRLARGTMVTRDRRARALAQTIDADSPTSPSIGAVTHQLIGARKSPRGSPGRALGRSKERVIGLQRRLRDLRLGG